MKIPKHIQRYIEGELINYPFNKKALAYTKQNLYLSTHDFVTPSQGEYFTGAVEQKALQLMPDRNIIRLEHSISTVEDILGDLPEEYRRLIELRYFKLYSPELAASELSISVRNSFRWRDKAIKFFAIRLGLM